MAALRAPLLPASLPKHEPSPSLSCRSPWRRPSFLFPIHRCPCRRKPLAPFRARMGVVSVEGAAAAGAAFRRERVEMETDAIAALHERIRRELGKREGVVPAASAVGSEEAEKYIHMVKLQQQRGLRKLKGGKAEEENGGYGYRVDPYTLRPEDYVVHKKVGIGKFVAIKYDVPQDGSEPIEYVFVEYGDGMAKLPVKQAKRMLYRYNL